MAFQFKLRLADMVLINYSLEADRVRPLIPRGLHLDDRAGSGGDRAWVSLVVFRVIGVEVNGWRLPAVSYNQLNCRVYVRSDLGPGVFFLALMPGSFLAAAGARLFGVPARRTQIELARKGFAERADQRQPGLEDAQSPAPGSRDADGPEGGRIARCRLQIRADGVDATVGADEAPAVDSDFITERPIGYVAGRGGRILLISALHHRLMAKQACVEQIHAPILNRIGIAGSIDETRPESVYYVEEAAMESDIQKAAISSTV
jgi:hypothetical protein